MIEIHNDIKEDPVWLFYLPEGKIESLLLENIFKIPGMKSVGLVENALAFEDVRAQVVRDKKNGDKGTYYIQYKGNVFEIGKCGRLICNSEVVEYPFVLTELYLDYMIGLKPYPSK